MSEQDPVEVEGEPAEPEEPKIILTEADIKAGLTNLYRIPSKSFSLTLISFSRRLFICLRHPDRRGERPPNSKPR